MTIKLHNNHSRGVTLIELLVVVAIISVLTAVMIPRLRTINKDRNIREAARVVGSVFANASQRAIAEGGSGVLLERNPNYTSTSGILGVNFACTTLYAMRNLPPYIGDDDAAEATIAGSVVTIDPAPIEHTAMNPVVVANDYISLNNNSIRYRISDVSANGSRLTLDGTQFSGGGGYLPMPAEVAAPDGVAFVIYRQPRKLESSRVDLPEGYMVDLRFSGPTLRNEFAEHGCSCNQATNPLFTDPATNEIRIIIDGKGTIEWMYGYDNLVAPDPGAIVGNRLNGPFYMFVSAFELDDSVMPIDRPSNLWVTVNQNTGGVNVGYSVPPTGLIDMDGDGVVGSAADRVLEARDIAAKQQSATQ